MRWLSDLQSPRALLVVAHPDDETIFAGGLVLMSQDTDWTVICATYESSDLRGQEFLRACAELSKESGNPVSPVLLGLQDTAVTSGELAPRLQMYSSGYDIVVTHNRMGKYGSEDHKAVHQAVVRTISNPNTWVFISPGATNVNQDELRSGDPSGNVVVAVARETRRKKLEVWQQCHVSQAAEYGYDWCGSLRNTDLRPILRWYFEQPGDEEYSFFR